MHKSLYYKGLNMYDCNKMSNYLNKRNINVFRNNVVNFVKNNNKGSAKFFFAKCFKKIYRIFS